MTFDPTTVEPILEELAGKVEADAKAKLKTNPPLGERLGQLVGAGVECLSIGIIYLHGFKEIEDGGPVGGEVPTKVQEWVGSVDKKRSAARLAGMIASSICSELEGFIMEVVPSKMSSGGLAASRKKDSKLSADDDKAWGTVSARLKPTVKAEGSKWAGWLETALSVTLTPEEKDTLIDMITFRNEYVHDPPTAFSKTISGEHLKCWALASMILCHRIAVT